MMEGALVLIGFVIGAVLMIIAFFLPQDEFSDTQTNPFSLNCSLNRVFPFYLQKDNKLIFDFYVLTERATNSSVILYVTDPNGQKVTLVGPNDFHGNESGSYNFISNTDGFYKLMFSALNCNHHNVKDSLLLSTITDKHKPMDLGGLQGIGSTLIGLSGGYAIGILKNRFTKPLGYSAVAEK